MTGSAWTAPDVVIAVLTALTPLAVVALGILVTRASLRIESMRWINQTVVARRLELFNEVATGFNQLLCFATFVGRWKEITPEQTIATKRHLDEVMYANRLLFSPQLFAAYQAFMATFYATYTTLGGDAQIRVSIDSQWGDRRRLPWWQDSMTEMFAATGPSTMDDISAAYQTLSDAFRADLYVTGTHRPLLSNRD